jgi:hypothetical protein
LLGRTSDAISGSSLDFPLEEQHKQREELVLCSGMHTKFMMEPPFRHDEKYVGGDLNLPAVAFTRGIPQQLEAINVNFGEVAIYSTLMMMMMHAAGFLGGFAPPASKHEDLRSYFTFFYLQGLMCCMVNICVSVGFREISAQLPRESDMLVVISKS